MEIAAIIEKLKEAKTAHEAWANFIEQDVVAGIDDTIGTSEEHQEWVEIYEATIEHLSRLQDLEY